jgi:hypothetical protein
LKTYPLQDGLVGMPLEAHLMVIDELLDAELSDGERRRELLIDHELLAAQAEVFVLSGGRRAFSSAAFFDQVKLDPEYLHALTSLVRDALFWRFVEDAAAAELI